MEKQKVKEKLETLKKMVEKFREDLRSFDEENTKLSLIVPFFGQLGYDVHNPYEFTSELLADCRTNGSDKVDYSIIVNDEPKVIIEAKRFGEKLHPHIGQLRRYYNVNAKIRYGILTNGTDYYFFTDTKDNNIMDEAPFYRLNIENVSERDLDFLQNFAKDSIFGDDDALKQFIGKKQVHNYLKTMLQQPTDGFLDFVKQQLQQDNITKEDIKSFLVEVTKIQAPTVKTHQNVVSPLPAVPVIATTTTPTSISQPTSGTPTQFDSNLSVVLLDVELLGHKFTTKKWIDLFISSLEILIKEKPVIMGQLDKLYPENKVSKFSYSKDDFPMYGKKPTLNAKQLSNGLYAFTRLSSDSIEGILLNVIEICGLTKDELKVTKHLKNGQTA